jgi:hypothetical protein
VKLLACNVDTVPCPPADQVWIDAFASIDPALLGVTAETIGHVYAWGLGSVLTLFVFGWLTSLGVGLIRKL